MNRTFPITLRRTFGAMPEIFRVTWRDPGPDGDLTVVQLYEAHLGLQLKSHTKPTEKPADLPLIAFGAYDQVDRKGPGCRGSNLNPEGVHCIALDYDDLTVQESIAVLQRAKAFSPEGLAHTTWSHGLTKAKRDPGNVGVRMRVVMPLDHAVSKDAWGFFYANASNALGGLEDTQCHNIDRFWFLPAVNVDAPAWVLNEGGCWLDVWGPT